jgi:hypothetical protein
VRLWRRRRSQVVPPRSNPTRIAALEQELLGIRPEPGTWAAAALALRRAGTCLTHRPIDVSVLGEQPGSRAVCAGCGRAMRLCEGGEWQIADDPGSSR